MGLNARSSSDSTISQSLENCRHDHDPAPTEAEADRGSNGLPNGIPETAVPVWTKLLQNFQLKRSQEYDSSGELNMPRVGNGKQKAKKHERQGSFGIHRDGQAWTKAERRQGGGNYDEKRDPGRCNKVILAFHTRFLAARHAAEYSNRQKWFMAPGKTAKQHATSPAEPGVRAHVNHLLIIGSHALLMIDPSHTGTARRYPNAMPRGVTLMVLALLAWAFVISVGIAFWRLLPAIIGG